MPYTLEQFAADCRAALMKDPGPAGRELCRQYTERACSDGDFVAKHFGPGNTEDRKILYEDPDLKFCILAHVYAGQRISSPHDHGPSWAIYGLAEGDTEMTDWKVVRAGDGTNPTLVEPDKVYTLRPGDAHFYDVHVIHSPNRDTVTKLVRIEGSNLDRIKRSNIKAASKVMA